MACSKCNMEINNPKEVIKCAECSAEFHVACSRIRTAAKLGRMSAKALAAWRCDDCTQETTSAASRSDTEDPSVLEMLKAINSQIADSKAVNKASFASLEKSMCTVQEEIRDLKSKLSSIEAENRALKNECAVLRHNNEALKEDVMSLQREVSEIQQYARINNAEIRGVPVTANENIYCVLESAAAVIGVDFNRSEISIAHRLPAPRDRRYHPSIVVQFVSRTIKASWISAAKKRKPTAKDLSPSFAAGPIFIGDHLTAHNREVLRWAKSYAQSGALAYVWSRDGKMFVRRTTTSAAVRVWTKDDVFRALKSQSPRRGQHSGSTSMESPTRGSAK